MDPLSALKMVGIPDLESQLAKTAQDAGATQKISIPDLEKLSPGLDLTSSGAPSPLPAPPPFPMSWADSSRKFPTNRPPPATRWPVCSAGKMCPCTRP